MDDLIAACFNFEIGSDFPTSDEPVWILGKEYIPSKELDKLKTDVESRLWLTYRKGFEDIEDTGITSDAGWGCMIRCGQMVLAEGLIRTHLGREWRWKTEELHQTYVKILSLFEDVPEKTFSIHNLSKKGIQIGKEIGEWHGPNTIAQSIRKSNQEPWIALDIYVVMYNMFIIDEIKAIINSSKKPILLFIPVRIGLSEFNPIYKRSIFNFLEMPQSVGIIGGSPNHALYFIGHSGENLIYLDPHTTQQTGSIGNITTEAERNYDSTYHCKAWNEIPLDQIDMSMSIGFLCQNEEDFDDFCDRLNDEDIADQQPPIFSIFETTPDFMKLELIDDLPVSISDSDEYQYDDNEFEILKL